MAYFIYIRFILTSYPMKPATILSFLLLLSFASKGQTAVRQIQTLVVSDSILWEIPQAKAAGSFMFSEWGNGDNFNFHFEPDKPVQISLKSGNNTLTVACPSKPTKTLFPIKLQQNGESKILNICYIPPFKPSFANKYKPNSGSIVFDNNAAYELVNVVFSLTEKGKKDASTFNINTDYFKEINNYFQSYKNHPLISLANKIYEPGSSIYRMYRESAYNYSFKKRKIARTGPYVNFEEGNTILDDLALWEDFAQKSNFLKFYSAHKDLYQKELTEAEKKLPVKQMWNWCESKFPDRYHTYRIVISPLVNGFHSTININSETANECVMFICGPNVINTGKYSFKVLEGLYSGIVFTEIDHNYINPLSENYKNELNKTFGDQRWIKKDSQAAGYGNGTAYFNEYFTHAVFLLYVKEHYSEQELASIEKERVGLMKWRGFPLFNEFYAQLSSLYNAQENKTDLSQLYPALIKWGNQMNSN